MFKLWKAFGVATLALAAFAVPAYAADYPTKPIKMVIPFGPGGSSDLCGRILSKYLAKELGQEVPIINVAGSAGFAGTLQVANAEPDGYTILMHLPTLMKGYHVGTSRITFDELTPIARAQQFNEVLAVRSDSPFKTAQELIDYAKANPGKLKWGLNIGAGLHFMALDFADASGTVGDWQYTQTGGDEVCVKSLLGGHIDVTGSSDAALVQHYKAGTVRILGAFSNERLPMLPDVPTFKEMGIDSQFIFDVTYYGPKNMDPAVVKKLQDAIKKVSADPEYNKELNAQGIYAAYLDGEALYNELLDQDVKFYKFARLGNLIPPRK